MYRWRDASTDMASAEALSPLPQFCAGERLLELHDALVGASQATGHFHGAHRRRDVRHLQAWHHRGDALGIVLGAVRQKRSVRRDELLHRLRPVAEGSLAEIRARIDLQEHVAELDGADDVEHRVPASHRLGIDVGGLQRRQMQMALGADRHAALVDRLDERGQAVVELGMQALDVLLRIGGEAQRADEGMAPVLPLGGRNEHVFAFTVLAACARATICRL